MRIVRFEVDGLGIYEAVDKHCPRNDIRRKNKPDGSWLPKIGERYPGAVSFWTEAGLKIYINSGLKERHDSVTGNASQQLEASIDDLDVFYRDDLQVIGRLK